MIEVLLLMTNITQAKNNARQTALHIGKTIISFNVFISYY